MTYYAHSHPNKCSKNKKQSFFAKKYSSRGFISVMKATCIPNAYSMSCLFITHSTFFIFFSRGIRIKIFILTKVVQKGWISLQKETVLLLKMFTWKGFFHDKGPFCANLLLYILSIYRKCFLYQFLCCGMHMHIPILRGVQNGRISHQKHSHNLLITCTF